MDTDSLENITFTAWKVRKKIQQLTLRGRTR
jgi:hypothetical protein